MGQQPLGLNTITITTSLRLSHDRFAKCLSPEVRCIEWWKQSHEVHFKNSPKNWKKKKSNCWIAVLTHLFFLVIIMILYYIYDRRASFIANPLFVTILHTTYHHPYVAALLQLATTYHYTFCCYVVFQHNNNILFFNTRASCVELVLVM